MGANKNSNFQKCGNILIDIKTLKSQDKSYAIICGFCNAEYDQIKIFSLHLEEKHSHDFVVELEQVTEPENSTSLIVEQEAIKIEEQTDINDIGSEKLGPLFTLREVYQNPLDSGPSREAENTEEINVPPIKREHREVFDEDEEYWDPQYNKRFHNPMSYSDEDMDTYQKTNDCINEKEYPLDEETSGNSKAVDEELVVKMDENSYKTSVLCDQEIQDTSIVTVNHLNSFKREFKQDLQRVNNEIKDQITGIKKVLTHILEQVKFSNNIVNGRPKTSLLPKKPFSSIEDFLQYETEIQNSEQKYLQLILEFELQTASCMQSFVKSIWRKLIEDGAAQFLCWKGTDKKKSVRSLSVTLALKEACVKKYGMEMSNDFERCCIHHFQHAKGRFQKKLNYVPRKPTN